MVWPRGSAQNIKRQDGSLKINTWQTQEDELGGFHLIIWAVFISSHPQCCVQLLDTFLKLDDHQQQLGNGSRSTQLSGKVRIFQEYIMSRLPLLAGLSSIL